MTDTAPAPWDVRPDTDEAPCPEDDCDFVAKSDFGLQAHARAKHGPDAPAPKAPATEPSPSPDGGTRRFRCKRYPKLVLSPHGTSVGRFVDGALETDNPKAIAMCRSLEYIDEVT